MLGGAGHSALEGGKVGGDAIDMEVNKGLLAFFAEEEGTVGGVVHEEIFHKDGGAGGVAEEVEVGFLVGVGVGVVGAEALAREVGLGGGVEGGGEGIGPGVATGGVGAPAAGGAQRRTKLTDEQVPLPLSTLALPLPLEQGTIGPDHRHRPKRIRPLCPPVDGVDKVDNGGQRWTGFARLPDNS